MVDRDEGYTLVELLVALALLVVALTMFGSALPAVMKGSAAQVEQGATLSQVRQALVSLDAQMRSGYVAAKRSGPGYEEVVLYTEAAWNGPSVRRLCAGWRLTDTAPQDLYMTTWDLGQPPPAYPSRWIRMATGIQNKTVAPATSPFSVRLYPTPTTPGAVGIALGVDFWFSTRSGLSAATLTSGAATRIRTTFTTRNVRRYGVVLPVGGGIPVSGACL